MPMNFGAAIEAVKKGGKVGRKGWNGKGMFVFMRPGDTIFQNVIPLLKSLPDTTRETLIAQERQITFNAYLCLYNAQGEVANGWLPSQSDIFAEDWIVIE